MFNIFNVKHFAYKKSKSLKKKILTFFYYHLFNWYYKFLILKLFMIIHDHFIKFLFLQLKFIFIIKMKI